MRRWSDPSNKTTIQMGDEAPMKIEADGSVAVERVLKAERWRRSQGGAEALARRQRLVRGLLSVLGVAVVGGIYTATRMPDYQFATVAAVTGEPRVINESGEEKPAVPGMRVRLAPEVAFSTNGTSTLALTTRGARLLLRQNTALLVKTARYSHGAIRRFSLKRGTVIAQVDPLRRDALFEVLAGTFRIRVRSRSAVLSVGSDGARSVLTVRTGDARMVVRNKKTIVSAGQQSVSKNGVLAAPAPASDERTSVLSRADQTLARLGGGVFDKLSGFFEETFLPPLEALESVLHLPTLIADVKARLATQAALQALSLTLVGRESAPQSVKELNIPRPLLDTLEDKRILFFQPLGGNNYELFARAKDSQRTVFILRNGKVAAANNDELPAEIF
ncbi:hypothetical protein [Armatimonas sp.]|uniref:hypothetical protein n=1 Tax=Armatimonas sp. TaxID=1872638 RepID=UPI003750297E